MKLPLSLLLLVSLVWAFSFQSCGDASTAESTITEAIDSIEEAVNETTGTNTTGTTTGTEVKSQSEMTVQEQADYVAHHAEEMTFIDTKMVEIKNEHVKKKDQFTFECTNGKISLERHYNDADEIHLLTYTTHEGNVHSTKHHFFYEDKLVYQYFHHEVEEGNNLVVDDHKTFFKDGKMIQCLEKRYEYNKYEDKPNRDYKQVDCVALDKLTKNIEKLLTLSEEEAKAFLCK